MTKSESHKVIAELVNGTKAGKSKMDDTILAVAMWTIDLLYDNNYVIESRTFDEKWVKKETVAEEDEEETRRFAERDKADRVAGLKPRVEEYEQLG